VEHEDVLAELVVELLADVLDRMPAVGDLDRVGGADELVGVARTVGGEQVLSLCHGRQQENDEEWDPGRDDHYRR